MTLENFNLLKYNLPPIEGSYFDRIKAENRRWEFIKILHEYLLLQRQSLSQNPETSKGESSIIFKKLVSCFWKIVSITNPNYWENSKTQIFNTWKNLLNNELSEYQLTLINNNNINENDEIPFE